jgi:hypothetical protein
MIYIQSNNDLPYNSDAACAMYGAMASNIYFKLIDYDELDSGLYDKQIKNNLFVGSVEFMRKVFDRIGIYNVRLPKNSNRESELITLGEAHQRAANGEKLFIKSYDIKLFTGLILDGCIYSSLENLSDDTKVIAYPVFKKRLLSEWRVYIDNNQIVDAKNYSGDFKIMLDFNYVENVLKENKKDFPRTYTIDIGIFEDNQNIVVEYNDMWAIGNYGVPNDIYLNALRNRYFEIIRQNNEKS